MTARRSLAALLAVVAAAAAVLSFAALRDLALLCGFSRGLAWLLPVVVDAGAAAGTLVWLGGRAAWVSARRLALTLLGVSIAANALSHGAEAWESGRPWWVVVVACVVSGLAPAVLGAVIHLAVRYWRGEQVVESPQVTTPELVDSPAVSPAVALHLAGPGEVGDEPGDGVDEDRAAQLIAEGTGRRKLAREMGLSEHDARLLIDRVKNREVTA